MDIIKILDALSRFAGTPLGFVLVFILGGLCLLAAYRWLENRYAPKSELHLLADAWNTKAIALQETADRVLNLQGNVHEKINDTNQRVAAIEAKCAVLHQMTQGGR